MEKTVNKQTLERFDSAVEEHGTATLLVVFLVPGLPDDAVCFISGLTEIHIWKLLAIAIIGRFPGLLVANIAGAGFAQNRILEAGILLLLLGVTGAVGYLKRAYLADTISRHLD